MAPERLLTIGEFSHLTRISVRMLRHYDERGVLRPTRVDEWTGYRHYAPELLAVAARICTLRDVGLGVAELAACAPLLDDASALRRVLDGQRQRLLDEAAAVSSRLRVLDGFTSHLEDTPVPTPITVRTVAARTCAAVRGPIPRYVDEPILWDKLTAQLPGSSASIALPLIRTATYHDESHVEHGPDVEVALAVTGPFEETGDLRCVRVPQTLVASAILHGPYEGLSAVLGDLGRWIVAEGYRMDGPPYSVYVVMPPDVADPAGWITEVCVPVAAVPS